MLELAQVFEDGQACVLLPGAVGVLEAITHTPDCLKANVTAVICHPHPQHGGTLHNKVVTTLHRACAGLGVRTVRFNYRGVGNSQGAFDQGVGEAADVLAVIDWVRRTRAGDRIWLLGFSFGASMVLKACEQAADPIDYVVCVAPPVDKPYFSAPWPSRCHGLVIQGDQDEVVSASAVTDWVNHIVQNRPDYVVFADVGHFFHGQLIALRACVQDALVQHIRSVQSDGSQ